MVCQAGEEVHYLSAQGSSRLVELTWFCRNTDRPVALVNRRDHWGLTPMDRACMGGHVEVCELLASFGARVYTPSSEIGTTLGHTTVHWACERGHLNTVEWLLRGRGVPEEAINEPNKQGNSPLSLAFRGGGSAQLWDWLADHGAVLQSSDPRPMREACEGGSVEAVEWLCAHGMEPTVAAADPNSGYNTPMHYASEHWHVGVVECLFQHGGPACITQVNGDGETPLHRALARKPWSVEEKARQSQIVDFLCSNGAQDAVRCGEEDDLALLFWARFNDVKHHHGNNGSGGDPRE